MKNFNFLSNLLQRVSAMSGMRAETINYDGQPTVNRRANMTSVLRHCKASDVRVAQEWCESGARVAQEWLQKSSARVAQGLRKSVRFAATILVLLWIGVGSAWGASFAPSDFSGQGTSGTGSAISATVDGVTFACDKGYGGTQFRCYKDGKITISSSSTITAISFTFSGSYTGGLETSYTGLSTKSWAKTLSSQARITACTVTVAASAKTFTLAVPKGDGTYDETQTGQEKTALTEANAIKKRNCGGGDLDGYYADIWTSTVINTPTSTYPSPVYTSKTADGSLPVSGTKLYPVFTNDAGKYLTNPSCAAVKTLSSIAITTAPTTTKYLVGETFSSAGAVVTATYSDATTATVSANWTPTTGLVSGSNTITATYTEGGVTKTATTTVTAYTVTIQKKDEDGTTIADAGVTASASGRTLTASAGSTHYVFKTWKYGTASGTSIASATSASTSLTGTPSAAVTVIAEFYKPCTVTWSVNGSTYHTSSNVSYNTTTSTPANPSVPDECTGSTFMGWTENSSWASDSAPGDLFNGTTPAITGDITFYAVFADEK